MTIDQEIVNAASIIGLLLVFVFGYFAALLPVVLTTLDSPRPDVAEDRLTLASRLRSYKFVVAGLLLLALLVLLILLPLSGRAVSSLDREGGFDTVKAGLILMDIMLFTLLVATGWLWLRLRRRVRDLRA